MRLRQFLFLLAGLITTGVLSQQYTSRQAARIFGNTTYVMGNEYASQSATLVNGVHDEPYLHVRYDNRYVHGDFNGDRLKDAAVIVIENNGGNADWYLLAFLINDGERLVHKASLELDDRAIINSILEKDGKVWIDMFIHQEGDCMGGPTKRVRNVYAYNGPDRWGEAMESSYQRIYADGVRELQKIYNTPIPVQIRKTFDRTVQNHKTGSADRCAFTVLNGEKQTSIFTKKFMVVGLEADAFSGVSVTLVFEETSHPFLLEVDATGDEKYELHNITELPEPLGEGFVRQLQNPAYGHYWL